MEKKSKTCLITVIMVNLVYYVILAMILFVSGFLGVSSRLDAIEVNTSGLKEIVDLQDTRLKDLEERVSNLEKFMQESK